MARSHTRHTVIMIGTDDISAFCDSSDFTFKSQSHDTTVYGLSAVRKEGGLAEGEGSLGGFYDTAVGGPRAVVKPLVGTVVTLTRRPEGTGAGKPQDVVDVLISEYQESAPVADFAKWSAKIEQSGPVNDTPQV